MSNDCRVFVLLACVVSFVFSGCSLDKATQGDKSTEMVKLVEPAAEPKASPAPKAEVVHTTVKSTDELKSLFDEHDFCLESVRTGDGDVPNIILHKLPGNMGKFNDLSVKKKTFIQAVLPMILMANEEVARERAQLLDLERRAGSWTEAEIAWLETLAEKYRMTDVNIKELISRVDVVPVSLALAQTIVETGWGKSYAARVKNSLFGTTIRKYVIPYDSLYHSVRSYIRNLNSNLAYRQMRSLRSDMRTKNQDLCSTKLISTMIHYCEFKQRYIKKVQATIAQNHLVEFDSAQLRSL